MSNKKMNEAIKKASLFIQSLQIIEDNSSEVGFDLFFSIADEGTLFLSGDEARNYQDILRLLIDSVQNEIISHKAIESLFQKAILSVLDISEKRREKSFDQRLEDALNDLRKSLNALPIAFSVYYPVHGLLLDGLPVQVGSVQFCIFDDVHLAIFTNLLNGGDGNDNTKNMNAYIADRIKQADINGKPIGVVDVKAIDPEAAKSLALKELSLTLDVINFFSDLIPYQKGYIYFPGDSEQLTINILIISKDEKPRWTFGSSRVGQLLPFSFRKLLEADKEKKLGFKKIANLLIKN